MARTKRKVNPIIAPAAETVREEKKMYRAAAYVRLSIKDSGRKGADTIDGQKKMLVDYISSHAEMELAGIWCDNGETGTNFSRPQFEAMMEKVKGGIVNCIVVKDLSRFGRNYKETGNYLERIFPFLGVRFIAVTDNFDTLTAERNENGYIVPLKNMINEAYSRDISKKIRSAFRSKQQRGELMTVWAPYGYDKDPDDKHRLVVNRETAPTVRQIFAWRAEGVSINRIARRLNETGVLSPSAYLYATGRSGVEKYRDVQWHQITIKRILENQAYLGHTVQGKRRSPPCDGQKEKRMPESEWVIVRDTHEPIIGEELFGRVQGISQARKDEYYGRLGKYDYMGENENIFRQLLYCADCQCPLVRSKRVYEGCRRYYFICNTHVRNPKDCTYKRVPEDELKTIVLSAIREQVSAAADINSVICGINNSPTFCREVEERRGRITDAKRTLKRCQSLYEGLYQNFVEGLIDEGEYISLRDRYKQQTEEAQRVVSALEAEETEGKQYTSENVFLRAFTQFQPEAELTRGMLTALVERIYIHGHDSVEIIFRYRDEYQSLQEFIEGRDGK